MASSNKAGYLGPKLLVTGRLSGAGDMTIQGVFRGHVDLDGQLVVATGGHVKAPIQAAAVAVSGTQEGAVAAGRVLVREGGRLIGDVRASTIGLEDGGSLEGTVEMDFELPSELLSGEQEL